MKLLKYNSMLILLMLLFSSIYANSSSFEEQSDEMEQLMKRANMGDNDNGSELESLYSNENSNENAYGNFNNIENSDSQSNSNSRNSEIELLETSSQIRANSRNSPKKVIKKTKPQTKNKTNKNLKNLKKPPQKKKPKKPKYPAPKYINSFNPWFPKKKTELKDNTEEKYCKFKRGFLYLVKNPNKLGPLPLTIHTIPIFVNLSMQSLNLFMGVNENSLFTSVNLENILKISKKFKNANCFEVFKDQIIEKTFAKIPLVLCASNSKSLAQWVRAIQQHKDCIYNNSASKIKETETLIDFNRVNKLLKRPIKKDKKLYYQPAPPLRRPISPMKNELSKIVGLLAEGQISQQQEKKKIEAKVKKASLIQADIKKKKMMIDTILDVRENKEKARDVKIKEKLGKKREIQLLRAVRSRIIEYKVNKIKK